VGEPIPSRTLFLDRLPSRFLHVQFRKTGFFGLRNRAQKGAVSKTIRE